MNSHFISTYVSPLVSRIRHCQPRPLWLLAGVASWGGMDFGCQAGAGAPARPAWAWIRLDGGCPHLSGDGAQGAGVWAAVSVRAQPVLQIGRMGRVGRRWCCAREGGGRIRADPCRRNRRRQGRFPVHRTFRSSETVSELRSELGDGGRRCWLGLNAPACPVRAPSIDVSYQPPMKKAEVTEVTSAFLPCGL